MNKAKVKKFDSDDEDALPLGNPNQRPFQPMGMNNMQNQQMPLNPQSYMGPQLMNNFIQGQPGQQFQSNMGHPMNTGQPYQNCSAQGENLQIQSVTDSQQQNKDLSIFQEMNGQTMAQAHQNFPQPMMNPQMMMNQQQQFPQMNKQGMQPMPHQPNLGLDQVNQVQSILLPSMGPSQQNFNQNQFQFNQNQNYQGANGGMIQQNPVQIEIQPQMMGQNQMREQVLAQQQVNPQPNPSSGQLPDSNPDSHKGSSQDVLQAQQMMGGQNAISSQELQMQPMVGDPNSQNIQNRSQNSQNQYNTGAQNQDPTQIRNLNGQQMMGMQPGNGMQPMNPSMGQMNPGMNPMNSGQGFNQMNNGMGMQPGMMCMNRQNPPMGNSMNPGMGMNQMNQANMGMNQNFVQPMNNNPGMPLGMAPMGPQGMNPPMGPVQMNHRSIDGSGGMNQNQSQNSAGMQQNFSGGGANGSGGMNQNLGQGSGLNMGPGGKNPSMGPGGMNPNMGPGGMNPNMGAGGMNPIMGLGGMNPNAGASPMVQNIGGMNQPGMNPMMMNPQVQIMQQQMAPYQHQIMMLEQQIQDLVQKLSLQEAKVFELNQKLLEKNAPNSCPEDQQPIQFTNNLIHDLKKRADITKQDGLKENLLAFCYKIYKHSKVMKQFKAEKGLSSFDTFFLSLAFTYLLQVAQYEEDTLLRQIVSNQNNAYNIFLGDLVQQQQEAAIRFLNRLYLFYEKGDKEEYQRHLFQEVSADGLLQQALVEFWKNYVIDYIDTEKKKKLDRVPKAQKELEQVRSSIAPNLLESQYMENQDYKNLAQELDKLVFDLKMLEEVGEIMKSKSLKYEDTFRVVTYCQACFSNNRVQFGLWSPIGQSLEYMKDDEKSGQSWDRVQVFMDIDSTYLLFTGEMAIGLFNAFAKSINIRYLSLQEDTLLEIFIQHDTKKKEKEELVLQERPAIPAEESPEQQLIQQLIQKIHDPEKGFIFFTGKYFEDFSSGRIDLENYQGLLDYFENHKNKNLEIFRQIESYGKPIDMNLRTMIDDMENAHMTFIKAMEIKKFELENQNQLPMQQRAPPGMAQEVQPGMHPGAPMQQRMQPGVPPGMQPGGHPGMQPGGHPGMQPGMGQGNGMNMGHPIGGNMMNMGQQYPVPMGQGQMLMRQPAPMGMNGMPMAGMDPMQMMNAPNMHPMNHNFQGNGQPYQ